jgi:protein involved in polysaccharide export with SLBB domain
VCLFAGTGCAGSSIDRALLADRNPTTPDPVPAARYLVQCPDVLNIRVQGPQPWQRDLTIDADGRIELQDVTPLRVEGLTTTEIATVLARRLRLPANAVEVRMVSYASRQIFVHGEECGLQRAMPYVGPETVEEFLQRLGGLGPDCAAGDIQVVRSHVADGKPPQVFTIDLEAIVLHHDQESNVRLEPFDQVYLGQSSRSFISHNLPMWMRPLLGLHKG